MAVSGMRAAFLLLYAGAACAAVDARGSLGTRPPPPHDLDCKMKALAYKYGTTVVQPQMSVGQKTALAEALWLGSECPAPPTATATADLTRPEETHHKAAEVPTVFVGDHGSNPASTETNTVSTVADAIALLRTLARPAEPKKMVLSPGVHFLGWNGTLSLTAQDSHLTIESAPEGQAWLSGGVSLGSDLKWTRGANGVWSTSLKGLLPPGVTVEALLRLEPHTRIERARYPNADTELAQWGYNSPLRLNYSFGANETVAWTRPPAGGATPNMSLFDFSSLPNAANLIKNDSALSEYNTYVGGSGGICDNWDTTDGQESYWCSNKSSGGWAEVDAEAVNAGQLGLPVGVKYNTSLRPGRFQRYENAVGGIIHAWHSQSWFVNMWEIVAQDKKENSFAFGRGGSQGGRSWCRCDQCAYAGPWCDTKQHDTRLISGGWYIENVFEELDAENEYYYNTSTETLYFKPNATDGTTPVGLELVVPVLETILHIDGTANAPVQNVNIRGVGFRDSTPTYLKKWGVPSGGDWALYRGGAVIVQGSEQLAISECTFRRLDANAVLLTGYNRDALIENSEFHFIGDTAIGLWGLTKKFDGTEGTQPRGTKIVGNFVHELGYREKQSSPVFQAKACQTSILSNIFFNLPRAAVNLNDGFGGDNEISGNLMFNSCRESGDHGVVNSWDREVFLTDVSGKPSLDPIPTRIHSNMMIANYGASQAIDNDDGSSWYHTSDNLFYSADGFKMDYGGHDSVYSGNLNVVLPYDGQNCLNIGSFLPGHGDTFENNTCFVFPCVDGRPSSACVDQVSGMSQCDPSINTVRNNRYFSTHGNASISCAGHLLPLASVQSKYGIEVGSTHSVLPSTSEIMKYAEAQLGLADSI